MIVGYVTELLTFEQPHSQNKLTHRRIILCCFTNIELLADVTFQWNKYV